MNDRHPDFAQERTYNFRCVKTGMRLDLFIVEELKDLSRSMVQKLVREELVEVNEKTCSDKNYRLRYGDCVSVKLPPPKEAQPGPEPITLDVLFEDADLLVVNKPRGMVVHPAPGHAGGTMVNALLHHCRDLSGIGGVLRPGIVHRLDKNTSGLLLVAKNDYTHHALSAQLKSRKMTRVYLALVRGRVKPLRGLIDLPIGRHPRDRKKMAVLAGGREAVTEYRVLKHYERYSLLELKLKTGRTHQIRVHLAHIGYPVAGDPDYAGGAFPGLPPELIVPQALHARTLKFLHPRSGREMEFSAPLPLLFRQGLQLLAGGER